MKRAKDLRENRSTTDDSRKQAFGKRRARFGVCDRVYPYIPETGIQDSFEPR